MRATRLLAPGTTTNGGTRVEPPGLVRRAVVIQAGSNVIEEEPDVEPLTAYEQDRLDQIYKNELKLYELGLIPVRPVAPASTPPASWGSLASDAGSR